MASYPKFNQLSFQLGGSPDGASRFSLVFLGKGDFLDWSLKRIVAQPKMGIPACDGDMFVLHAYSLHGDGYCFRSIDLSSYIPDTEPTGGN